MKAATPRSPRRRSPIGNLAIALGLAVMLGGAYAAPVRADDHDQRGHAVHRDAHRHNSSYGSVQPGYVYAPPPVYYPAPMVAPPAIDFVFPICIR